MRANSDDNAGDGLAAGGARRSGPSIFTCFAPWLFLCLYVAHSQNSFSGCELIFF
jgi:hypothetical protein